MTNVNLNLDQTHLTDSTTVQIIWHIKVDLSCRNLSWARIKECQLIFIMPRAPSEKAREKTKMLVFQLHNSLTNTLIYHSLTITLTNTALKISEKDHHPMKDTNNQQAPLTSMDLMKVRINTWSRLKGRCKIDIQICREVSSNVTSIQQVVPATNFKAANKIHLSNR